MRTITQILIIVLIFTATSIFGQVKETSDYAVLKTGDTLYGSLSYIGDSSVNPTDLKKIRITGESDDTKIRIKEVLSFKSKMGHYEAFWISQSSEKIILLNPIYDIDSVKGEKQFLKVVSKGSLSHYQLEWYEQGESLLMSMDLLKRTDDSYFIRATQGLFGLKRKTLANYFEDCPYLAKQIIGKELNTLNTIVNYYNSHCEK